MTVAEFRKPPSTRTLSPAQLRRFLKRFDPDGRRLPLLHDLEPGAKVILSRGAFHAIAELWSDGEHVLSYTWSIGHLREQVTTVFSTQRRHRSAAK